MSIDEVIQKRLMMAARRRFVRLLAMAVGFAAFAASGVPAYAGPSYSFTTVDYPGAANTELTGISGGSVVGYYYGTTGNANSRGFIYDGSTFTTLDYPGALYTKPNGVSGNTVVGQYEDSAQVSHGFVYNGSTFTTLDYPGAYSTAVNGISGGTVVGQYESGNGLDYTEHGFIYDGSTFTTLDYPGPVGTTLSGISGGTVVGNAGFPFIYDGSTFTTPLAGTPAYQGTATGISGNTVVGYYEDESQFNINRGFIYDGSTFMTLDAPSGITELTGIDGGTLVGSYFVFSSQSQHGFIAHQVPEPASLTLLSLAAIALLPRWRGVRCDGDR